MTAFVSITETQVYSVLRQFLVGIMPTEVEVVRGQINRVPEPSSPDFIVMSTLRRQRLATNVDDYDDVVATGAIDGTTLTISAIAMGTIGVGQPIRGAGIAPNTHITGLLHVLTDGTGTYSVSPSQTVASGTIIAGARTALMSTQMAVQLDVHGPNSADNAQIIATLFRDEEAVTAFAAGYNVIMRDSDGNILYDGDGNPLTYAVQIDMAPLFASDARQVPFINAEQQYEFRWSLDVEMQINPIVLTAQDFADEVEVGLINVDVTYPP